MKKKLKYILLCTVACLATSAIKLNAQQHVHFEWVRQMGGSNATVNGKALTVDAGGNVYSVGNFKGTADFNPGSGVTNFTSAGTTFSDFYISKLNTAGDLVWTGHIGGSGIDSAEAITLDDAGNMYIVGRFQDTVDFDPGTGTTQLISTFYSIVGPRGPRDGFRSNIFILKLDADGNFIWAKSMLGLSGTATSVAIDNKNQRVCIAGYYGGTVDFDPGGNSFDLTSNGQSDIFVATLDTAGNFIWAKGIGSSKYNDAANAITVDTLGNIYITGDFRDTVDFNPGATPNILTTTLGYDVFVAKLDTSGKTTWAKSMSGIGDDWGRAITVDDRGNVYTTGAFQGTNIDFDPGPNTYYLSANGQINMFISKLDQNGDFVWAGRIGKSNGLAGGANQGTAVVTDQHGHLFYTGFFIDSIDFDPGPGTAYLYTGYGATNHLTNIFVLKLDTAGHYMWAKQMGGRMDDMGYSIGLDGSGNIYTTGSFWGDSVDFDPDTSVTFYLKGYGARGDAFVHKLSCIDTSSSSAQVELCSDQYVFNGVTYKESGHYVQHLYGVEGCDSTVTLDLTLKTIIPAKITVDEFVLGTVSAYATYQWLLNGVLIPGATNNTYHVMQNGDYQVIVTNEEGCTDTSDSYPVTNYTGIADINGIAGDIRIYPNPSSDLVYIHSPVVVNATLTDLEGRTILKIRKTRQLSVKDLANGVYLLHITNREGSLIKVEKLTKSW